MRSVGIRQLKARASHIVHRVQETGEGIEVTCDPGTAPHAVMVVDASVGVSRLVPHDVHHAASRRWLDAHVGAAGVVVAPALLRPEVAGAISRRTGEARLARRAVALILRSLYVATAARVNLPLMTWDAEQREGTAPVIEVLTPALPEVMGGSGRPPTPQRSPGPG